MDTANNTVVITDQRIIEKRGILSKITRELELYRVRDIQHSEPFFLRIFGLSSIVLTTMDHDNPVQTIKGIDKGLEIKEKLRLAIEKRRDLKGVRELDVH
ncbi:PH domain-containing protein [Allomuricauda taeanensis]|nr:PH domain-containing protein [Allomuricauda taeanensis]